MAKSRQGYDDWSKLYDKKADDDMPPVPEDQLINLPSNAKATPRKPAKSVSSTSTQATPAAPSRKGKGKMRVVTKKGKGKAKADVTSPGASGSRGLPVIVEEDREDADYDLANAPTPRRPRYDNDPYDNGDNVIIPGTTAPTASSASAWRPGETHNCRLIRRCSRRPPRPSS
ncbi:hypothetical protein GX50_02859 [[Emmonsia] crescens]|uniref:Uncharacterized protein n=1 Tax=[Emmonsia] crescens TaxID=73230 RepID=A0A2B7ZJX9_9EURO|nr:hypothetical protein GX50_02859 [Emmonsia crescens]